MRSGVVDFTTLLSVSEIVAGAFSYIRKGDKSYMLVYLICAIIIILNYITIPAMFGSLDFIGSMMVATTVNLIVCTVIILIYKILEEITESNLTLKFKVLQELKKVKD